MKSLPIIAICAGLFLLLVSVSWSSIFPAEKNWTVEKDTQMSDLGVKAHKLGGELDAAKRRPSMHGRSAADIEAEYKQTTDQLAQLREEFESARDRPDTIATILRWVGVACVAVGAGVNFAKRSG